MIPQKTKWGNYDTLRNELKEHGGDNYFKKLVLLARKARMESWTTQSEISSLIKDVKNTLIYSD